MLHPQQYKDRRVVVLGLAKSGVAVAETFHRLGADVVVNDKKERSLCPEADGLSDLGISVICGHHPEDLIDEHTALVVKNPGIPYGIPPVRRALELGIEVVTEVEVACHLAVSPIIGITGSNGKTTTTTLVHLMLKEAGLGALLAGNIGRAMTEAVLAASPEDWLVTELSSFQLKGTVHFRPRIACLLNLYETHLDYHGGVEDYAASKAKLFANQTEVDTAVLNWDDSFCRKLVPELKAELFPFSAKERLDKGVYLDGEKLVAADGSGAMTELIAATELGIPGSHNVENALAASAVALAAGADPASIGRVLATFQGVEHRLEFVRELDGVSFYNDSKATNPAASVKSIEAFGDRPVVLVCGGQERGSDYNELLGAFRHAVRAVVVLGENRGAIAKVAAAAGIKEVETVEAEENVQSTVQKAVEAASRLAHSGDVVLLSPASASWDMFPSYEVRGRMFKHSVHTL